MTRGEIYLANLPIIENWSTQAGVRPVIIVSNEECNAHSPVIHVVPITSKLNKNIIPTHIAISVDCGLKMESVALCEQSMLVSKDVLFKKVGECDNITLNRIGVAILIQFGLFQFSFLKKLVTYFQKKNASHKTPVCA